MRNLPRFYIADSDFLEGKFYLKDHNSLRHARKVLRLGKGDDIELFDGNGKAYLCKVELLTKELLIADLIKEQKEKKSNKPNIILAQALPKAGKIDDIVRMNTEIGVSEFVLFESDHSVVKTEHYHENKISRLKKIIQEAARQSNNNLLPQILGPIDFNQLMSFPADKKLILHTQSTSYTEKIVDNITKVKTTLGIESNVLVCIGPEGGFSKAEISKAIENGFMLITLELPVLRTETAGLVVCSFLLI
jgi:16S rRNA (uracil1498-N3)-methyltransferase